ncbi:MAG: hypothetical protein GY820_14905 [Gammaproteobacteria bacterium]|nr:hypothetical protein [Gammaproteobacteria bacterium]
MGAPEPNLGLGSASAGGAPQKSFEFCPGMEGYYPHPPSVIYAIEEDSQLEKLESVQ